MLALTTTDGNFFLGTLSKTTCWLRNIAVTDGSKTPPSVAAAIAAGTRIPKSSAPPSYAAGADDHGNGQAQPVRGWGWRLLGTGRDAVAAAATAWVDALSSPPPADADGVFFADGGGAGGLGARRRQPGEAGGAAAGGLRGAGATGAVGVEFSAKGCLMAVGLADGTVLLTRVDRYTSGVRYALRCNSCWEGGRCFSKGGRAGCVDSQKGNVVSSGKARAQTEDGAQYGGARHGARYRTPPSAERSTCARNNSS